MGRRILLAVLILAVVSLFLVWGQPREGYAAKEERFWFTKIIDKLDQVLQNQRVILAEIKSLKQGMSIE